MPTSKQRVFVPLIAILLFTLGGILVGYIGGHLLAIRLTNEQLVRYADHVLGTTDAASNEAATILVKIDSLPFPHCSAQEINYLRSLIFASHYLKDSGHMLFNKIECSSMLGKLQTPLPVEAPNFSSAAGTHIFKTLPGFATAGMSSVGAQLGDAYVVFSPWLFYNSESARMLYTVTLRDRDAKRSGYLIGEQSGLPLSLLVRNQGGMVDGTMYATRCSLHFPTCITTFSPATNPLAAKRLTELIDSAVAGLFGLAFGFLWSIYYRRNRSLDHQLRRAIENDDFRMVYQPIVDVRNGRIIGAESLIRWNDEEGLPVSPDVLITLAEDRGFICQITRLVVRHVFRDLDDTLRRLPNFRVSINVSAADLVDPKFLPMMEAELREARVSPNNVAIEVTERCMACSPMAIETVHSLRKAGFSVQIDDFGTGYSSLSCLNNFAVDTIKVDRAFIQAVGTDSVTLGVLPLILAMAESLNLEVILEGVETQEQVDFFTAFGTPLYAQGWYFGRPMPAEHLKKALMKAEEKKRVKETAIVAEEILA